MTGEEYSAAGCARLFGKLAAKDVWHTPAIAFFQTDPDVFSSAPFGALRICQRFPAGSHTSNIEASHVPAKALGKYRLAGQMNLRAIHDRN
jgi:hypothetical protein